MKTPQLVEENSFLSEFQNLDVLAAALEDSFVDISIHASESEQPDLHLLLPTLWTYWRRNSHEAGLLHVIHQRLLDDTCNSCDVESMLPILSQALSSLTSTYWQSRDILNNGICVLTDLVSLLAERFIDSAIDLGEIFTGKDNLIDACLFYEQSNPSPLVGGLTCLVTALLYVSPRHGLQNFTVLDGFVKKLQELVIRLAPLSSDKRKLCRDYFRLSSAWARLRMRGGTQPAKEEDLLLALRDNTEFYRNHCSVSDVFLTGLFARAVAFLTYHTGTGHEKIATEVVSLGILPTLRTILQNVVGDLAATRNTEVHDILSTSVSLVLFAFDCICFKNRALKACLIADGFTAVICRSCIPSSSDFSNIDGRRIQLAVKLLYTLSEDFDEDIQRVLIEDGVRMVVLALSWMISFYPEQFPLFHDLVSRLLTRNLTPSPLSLDSTGQLNLLHTYMAYCGLRRGVTDELPYVVSYLMHEGISEDTLIRVIFPPFEYDVMEENLPLVYPMRLGLFVPHVCELFEWIVENVPLAGVSSFESLLTRWIGSAISNASPSNASSIEGARDAVEYVNPLSTTSPPVWVNHGSKNYPVLSMTEQDMNALDDTSTVALLKTLPAIAQSFKRRWYHGTSWQSATSILTTCDPCDENGDFGGPTSTEWGSFYIGDSFAEAVKCAKSNSACVGMRAVVVFEEVSGLREYVFAGADSQWSRFVSFSRQGSMSTAAQQQSEAEIALHYFSAGSIDVVRGPVASVHYDRTTQQYTISAFRVPFEQIGIKSASACAQYVAAVLGIVVF